MMRTDEFSPALGLFRQGQIIWACWCAFAGPFYGTPSVDVVPGPFRRRAQKFLQLGVPEGIRTGKGAAAEYTFEDAFELGLALDLADLGLVQIEIVAIVRSIREDLRFQVQRLRHAKRRGEIPNRERQLLLFLRPISITEAQRRFEREPKRASERTNLPEPAFAFGFEAVLEQIERIADRDRKRIVIDLSELFLLLDHYLSDPPLIRTGPRQ